MESNGWSLNGFTNEASHGEFFRGWASQNAIARLSTILKGSGIVTIDYENANSYDVENNIVRILVNGTPQHSLNRDERKTFSISFSDGDELVIEEHFSVLQLHKAEISCGSNITSGDQFWCLL